MVALLDGDLIAYRNAASAENEPLEICLSRVDSLIDTIMRETSATEYLVALSGETNFRHSIYPEYKANRKDIQRPKWLLEAKQYLKDKFNAVESVNCEADDLLGVWQCTLGKDTIICTLDKDLRMIPGKHYSWEIRGTSKLGKEWVRPSEIVHVTTYEATMHFYKQLIIGDPSDNVKGVKGLGPKAAERILFNLVNEQDMLQAVREAYGNDEEMLMNGKCLWIWRKENDIWSPNL
jgi:5'-3' exonuclease